MIHLLLHRVPASPHLHLQKEPGQEEQKLDDDHMLMMTKLFLMLGVLRVHDQKEKYEV